MSLITDLLKEAQGMMNNIPQLNGLNTEDELNLELKREIYSFVGIAHHSCNTYYANQNGEITSFEDMDEDGRKLYNLIFDMADLIP